MATPIDIDQAVKAYLISRGYDDAARALEEQSDKLKTVSTMSDTKGPEYSVQDRVKTKKLKTSKKFMDNLLFAGVLEGRASNVVELYNVLEHFVTGSLEQYRTELNTVTFPVFAHFYIDLVMRGASKEAKRLMSTWSSKHSEHYNDEIRSLSAVTAPEHALASDIIQRFRKNPFRFSLSCQSISILDSWITSAPVLLPIQATLNTRMHITVEDRPPRKFFKPAMCSIRDTSIAKNGTESLQILALPISTVASAKRKRGDDGQSYIDDNADLRPEDSELENLNKLLESEWYQDYLRKIVLRPLNPADIKKSAAEILGYKTQLANNGDICTELADAKEPTSLMITFINHGNALACMEIAPDAARIATGYEDSCVRVHKTSEKGQEDSIKLIGHSKPVYALSWAPDSRFLLTSGGDGNARLWDLEWSNSSPVGEESREATPLVAYKGHRGPIWATDFSPMGYYFSTGGADRTVRLWSTDRPHALRIFAGHIGDVTALKIHPNGAYLVSVGGGGDRTARLWDIRSGKCVRIFSGHSTGLSCVSLCPTGRSIAVGGDDGHVRIFNISSGQQMISKRGHTDSVETLAYSADGFALASGGRDCCVKIWDTQCAAQKTNESESQRAERRNEESMPLKQIHTFNTKATPVYTLRYTQQNLLLGAGPFLAENR